MSVGKLPFEYTGGKGHNTRIDYLFRDGDITVKETVIIEGSMDAEQAQELSEALSGKLFDPNKLGLPDLFSKMPVDWNEGYNTLHEIERIGLTDRESAEFSPTVDQILILAENADLPATWSTENSMS